MALSAPANLQFYIGVGGQQSGPFSQQDLINKIQAGEVPKDTLVWYDGLPDWQPIDTIDYLKTENESSVQLLQYTPAEPKTAPAVKPSSPSVKAESSIKPGVKPIPVTNKIKTGKVGQTGKSTVAEPVVQDDDDDMGDLRPRRMDKKTQQKLVVLGVCVAAAAGFYLMDESPVANIVAPSGKAGKNKPAADTMPKTREGIMRKALSELVLKPNESIPLLIKVVAENGGDKLGKEASQAVVDYYRQRQRLADAGRFLMSAKQPEEAARLFMGDPSTLSEADEALFAAYEQSKSADKRDFLLEDVKLLVGPLKKEALAIERLKRLEQDFPGRPHPYSYYLKTPDQKITDLFQRISFFFVQSLLAYVASEFPQLSMAGRPVVEVKRDKDNNFRIVGSYKGDVILNQDRLRDIKFVFWMYNDQWALVETNFTVERAGFSAAEKKRREREVMTSAQMLDYVETVFRIQFPKNLPHEATADLKIQAETPKTVE